MCRYFLDIEIPPPHTHTTAPAVQLRDLVRRRAVHDFFACHSMSDKPKILFTGRFSAPIIRRADICGTQTHASNFILAELVSSGSSMMASPNMNVLGNSPNQTTSKALTNMPPNECATDGIIEFISHRRSAESNGIHGAN